MQTIQAVISNFRTIIETAKAAKDLKLSEMTQRQQHAVQFCSWIRHARENPKNPGKLTYVPIDQISLFTVGSALVPAVTDIKKLYKKLGGDTFGESIKLFSISSFAIMIDTTPLSFKEADPIDALEAYPDLLLIPSFAMKDTTEGLPPIILEEVTHVKEEPIDVLHRELTTLLYKLSSRTAKLTKSQTYATHLILEFTRESDNFLNTVRRFMPYFPRDLSSYHNVINLPAKPSARSHIDELENHVFKSIECTAVYLALKGIFIKV